MNGGFNGDNGRALHPVVVETFTFCSICLLKVQFPTPTR